MEMEAQMFASPPHASAGLTVQPADIRPAKKRRTGDVGAQACYDQPLGEAGIQWAAVAPFGVNTHGLPSATARQTSGLLTPSDSTCSPGQYPPWAPDHATSNQIAPWPGVFEQGNCMPSASPLYAASEALLGADATAAPGHAMWCAPPPSPMQEIAVGPMPRHWSPSRPPNLPPGLYDQLMVGWHYPSRGSPSTVLPATPPVIPPYARHPPSTGNGRRTLAGQPGAHPVISFAQNSYPPPARGLTAHAPASHVDDHIGDGPDRAEVKEDHTPLDLQRSTACSVEGAIHRNRESAPIGPQGSVMKQPGQSDWTKEGSPDQVRWNQPRTQSLETPLRSPPAKVVGGGTKSCLGPDDEQLRDWKAFVDDRLRKETCDTRSMGACLRCHYQRVRCVPNKRDRKSILAPCETCLKVRRDTKKTIHHLPCLRYKVTSMTVFRPGGLGLTQRFDHTKVVNITDYSDDLVYDIDIAQGLCHQPLRVRARRFNPNKTDVTYRRYMEDGVARTQEVGAFCLVDAEETAKEFTEYIQRNAFDGLNATSQGSDDLLQDVFDMVVHHYNSLPPEDQGATQYSRKHPAQKRFLQKLIHLWFAIRHGFGSAWLDGEERLGIEPGSGHGHPLPGRVSVPRPIVAQLDSIRCERFYKSYAPDVLRRLETLLASPNKTTWFTVFLATFMLLHLTAQASADRYRHARENEVVNTRETRYGAVDHPLTAWVEEVHHGSAMMLAHWHYFKRCDLMSLDRDGVGDSALDFLEPYQLEFVKKMVSRLKHKCECSSHGGRNGREKAGDAQHSPVPSIPMTPAEGCWENELFWISGMFVSSPTGRTGWTAPEIFTRAKPSVGRD